MKNILILFVLVFSSLVVIPDPITPVDFLTDMKKIETQIKTTREMTAIEKIDLEIALIETVDAHNKWVSELQNILADIKEIEEKVE